MPTLGALLREAVRHPGRMAAFAIKRAMEVPTKGLPKLRAGPTDDFDSRHGVETATAVQFISTDSPNRAHGTRYETTQEATIRWCVEHAGLDGATFIDFGCGKGRTLIVAASYSFHAVIGIEYSHELVEIARRNVAKCGVLADVVEADAATWPLPPGPLLAYFYNPFGDPVHAAVLERLRSHPSPVVIAHRGPGNERVRALGFQPFASLRAEAAHLYRL